MIKIFLRITFILWLFIQSIACQIIHGQSTSDCFSRLDPVDTLLADSLIFITDLSEINCLSYLSALKSYPHLNTEEIHLRRKSIKTMMVVRPTPDFIFRQRENRAYQIIISKRSRTNSDSILLYMNCMAAIGIFGHELAHIETYSGKTNMGLLFLGVRYLFNKRAIERQTDQIVIERGLGNELLEYNRYIYSSPYPTEKYLKIKRKNYLSEQEIQDQIEKYF